MRLNYSEEEQRLENIKTEFENVCTTMAVNLSKMMNVIELMDSPNKNILFSQNPDKYEISYEHQNVQVSIETLELLRPSLVKFLELKSHCHIDELSIITGLKKDQLITLNLY